MANKNLLGSVGLKFFSCGEKRVSNSSPNTDANGHSPNSVDPKQRFGRRTTIIAAVFNMVAAPKRSLNGSVGRGRLLATETTVAMTTCSL